MLSLELYLIFTVEWVLWWSWYYYIIMKKEGEKPNNLSFWTFAGVNFNWASPIHTCFIDPGLPFKFQAKYCNKDNISYICTVMGYITKIE